MWASAGPGQSSSSPIQWESDGCVKIYNSCQREISTDEIQEKKNYRVHSNIKSARVSALTGSVPRKMAEALQSVSALIRNRNKVAKLTVTHLNYLAFGSYQLLEKNGS